MVFANTQMPGMDFGFPDVCLTEVVVPVPIPYPNLAPSIVAVPTQFETFILCMPAHNVGTMREITQGDDLGLLGGLISHTDMGPSMNVMFVTNVIIGGTPATKWTNMTLQNMIHCPGMTLVPCQEVVMMLQ